VCTPDAVGLKMTPKSVTVIGAGMLTRWAKSVLALAPLYSVLQGWYATELPYTTTLVHCELTHCIPAGQTAHEGPHALLSLVVSTQALPHSM
jgi:hypothetical protein